MYIASVADSLPPWGTQTQRRDKMLREFFIREPFLAGAVGSVCASHASYRWEIESEDDELKKVVTAMLETAHFGEGWTSFASMVTIDYLTQDRGAYVEIIRGTPLFVQIVFAWSVLLVNYPRLDDLGLIAGIAALTANTGGYQSEIFRAGLQTVHAGQAEAARAVGMSRLRAMRYVVLPQALRLIIPPLTNEYIGLLKASSFLFVIGVQELTTVGKSEAFREFKVFEVFALVTGIYFLMTVPLSKAIAYVERRYRIPGLGMQQARTARV